MSDIAQMNEPVRPTRRQGAERKIEDFDLKAHLRRTPMGEEAARHLRYGLESWLATHFIQGSLRMERDVPEPYRPRWGQYKQIEQEMHSFSTKRRQLLVFGLMPFMGGFEGKDIDFTRELSNYEVLDYHNYYLQPFHSLPGGWLSPLAAMGNESAMRALFKTSTKRGAEGLREVVASVLPRDAKVVYDFGAACGAQAAAFAERLGPDARVVCVDPSPFGLILGRKKHRDPRLQWKHAFAEEADLPKESGDFVNFFFVLHETPDEIKKKLLAKAFEVLKPGGKLLVSEPPLWDLEHRSRGFFEPYRKQWEHWQGKRVIEEAGFVDVVQEDIAHPDYVLTFMAKKPA